MHTGTCCLHRALRAGRGGTGRQQGLELRAVARAVIPPSSDIEQKTGKENRQQLLALLQLQPLTGAR